jgi:hypothetical protein
MALHPDERPTMTPTAAMRFFSLGVVLWLTLTGCSPSAGNELKHWETNQKAAAEFKAAYPGFSAVIDERMGAAKKAFDAAGKEADEAKMAEQMKAANAMAGDKMAALKIEKSSAGRRDEAMGAARAELDKVKAALAAVKPATVAEAEAALRPQISALIAAKGAADRALTALSPKKAAKK